MPDSENFCSSETELAYKRHSMIPDYNYLYNPLPILSTFPSRRPSMCLLTEKLVESAREKSVRGEGEEDIKHISAEAIE